MRAIVLTAVTLLTADAACAQSNARPPGLTIVAPPDADCSTPEQLAVRIEAQLARPALAALGSRTIEVNISPLQPAGFQASLALLDGAGSASGERVLTSHEPSCKALDASLTLVIATLLGPNQAAEPAAPEPAAPQLPEPSAAASERPRYIGRPVMHKAHKPWTVRAGLAAALGNGLLPGAQLGASTSVLLERGDLTLRLGVLAWPHTELALGEHAEARLAAVLGQLAACGVGFQHAYGRLGLCAGAGAGSIFSRTSGLALNQHDTTATAQLDLSARYDGGVTRVVGWYVAAGANFPVITQRFFIVEQDLRPRYYHTTRPGLLGELGVILRLPP